MHNPLQELKKLWNAIIPSRFKSIEPVPQSLKKRNKTMSLELKVNTSFKHSIDFMRDRVIANLAEARSLKQFKIDDREFEKVCNLIVMSIDQASAGVFKQADGLIKDIQKNGS